MAAAKKTVHRPLMTKLYVGQKLDPVIKNIVNMVLTKIDKAEDSAEEYKYLIKGVIKDLNKFNV